MVAGCRLGDRGSQKSLYEKFAPLLFSICRRYSPDDETAKDYLQDAFIRIFEKIGDLKSDDALVGWMKRVAVTIVLERIRRSKRMVYTEDYAGYDREDEKVADALSAMQKTEIMQLISGMPEGYRTVLNLYSIDGYSHAEIGEILGISEQGSRSQLSRAKRYLMQKLKESGMLD